MLVLVAGQGRLPGLIAEALEAAGREFRIAELEGFPMDKRGGRPVLRFRVERLGSFLEEIRELGAVEVCFAGTVHRPRIDPAEVDPATMPLVPRIVAALTQGDDGALRAVIGVFEEAGFEVRAAHEILPDLLPGAGVLTAAAPSERDRADAARGVAVVAAMGAADIGQSCVVASGQVVAVEALPGTDWMLAMLAFGRDGNLIRSLSSALGLMPGGVAVAKALQKRTGIPIPEAMGLGPDFPEGGILYKAPKPGQDHRIDLPAIGPATVRAAGAAGLSGIAIEAGGVMVLELEETVRAADAAGLFLWVRSP